MEQQRQSPGSPDKNTIPGENGGFITPSRASPEGKFVVDQPLSTKREKVCMINFFQGQNVKMYPNFYPTLQPSRCFAALPPVIDFRQFHPDWWSRRQLRNVTTWPGTTLSHLRALSPSKDRNTVNVHSNNFKPKSLIQSPNWATYIVPSWRRLICSNASSCRAAWDRETLAR